MAILGLVNTTNCKTRKRKGNGEDVEVLTHDESVFSAHRDDCAVYRPQQRRHNVLNVLKCVSLEEKKTKTLVICILALNRTASKRSKIFSLSHPIKTNTQIPS